MKQINQIKNSPKVNENVQQANIKDLDDYVLVFNKPTKDNHSSNIIQIPQSKYITIYLIIFQKNKLIF